MKTVLTVLLLCFFSIFLSSCSVTQYIPEKSSETSEKNLSTIIVSEKASSKLFKVDNTDVFGRQVYFNPGKHQITYGKWGSNPEYDALIKDMESRGYYFNGRDFVKPGSVSSPINMPDRMGFTEIVKDMTFEAGKIYGLRGTNFEKIRSISYNSYEWRGFTVGLLLGSVTSALVEGIISSKEQDDIIKRTGDTNTKLPFKYSTVVVSTLLSSATGFLIGYLIKTINY
jgi:hypothetical protein